MSVSLHTLKSTPGSRQARMRVGRGRGSGKGKTAGRGHKGQMARKGHKRKLGFEGGQMRLIRRLPKRGFGNPTRRELAPVNLRDIARITDVTEITPEMLKSRGFVKGRHNGVKILGDGALTVKLSVKAHAFSAAARAKIEAAGGTCEVVQN
jgi:large subunit ribosomal protein L15